MGEHGRRPGAWAAPPPRLAATPPGPPAARPHVAAPRLKPTEPRLDPRQRRSLHPRRRPGGADRAGGQLRQLGIREPQRLPGHLVLPHQPRPEQQRIVAPSATGIPASISVRSGTSSGSAYTPNATLDSGQTSSATPSFASCSTTCGSSTDRTPCLIRSGASASSVSSTAAGPSNSPACGISASPAPERSGRPARIHLSLHGVRRCSLNLTTAPAPSRHTAPPAARAYAPPMDAGSGSPRR